RFTVLRHPDIERMLEEAALNTGFVSVQRGTTCSDLIEARGRIVGVRTSKGSVEAELTVIAGGAQSTLRDRYFEGRDYYKYPSSFFNARFKLVEDFADAGFYILGTKGVMIIAPLPNGEMRIAIQQRQSCKEEKVSHRNVIKVIGQRLRTFPID